MKKSEIQILVVDDDPTLRGSLCEFIKKWGYKAAGVGKVDEAINFIKIKPVQMAIVDCMLPKMNGMDLVTQFRSGRFGDSPVILMSGIFKDKSFAAEAITKTKAIGFIEKPFDNKELKTLIDKGLEPLLSDKDVSLNSLVSKHNSSAREQLKSVEQMEELQGFELPLVISVLIAAEFSGHLNLASSAGDIYGVTFNKGKIVKVDGPKSREIVQNILLEKGFLTAEELEEYKQSGKKGDLLTNLVEENLLSPHLIPAIKGEQVLSELRAMFEAESLNLNLVPDRIREKGSEVGADEMLSLYGDIARKIDLTYLETFYEPWMEFPVRKSPSYIEGHIALKHSLVKDKVDIAAILDRDSSLREVMSAETVSTEAFLKALHFLSLARLIYFDDVRAALGIEEHARRLEKIKSDIEGKNPEEIFQYFGASSAVKPLEVERIYKEFAKANHPDAIPPGASDEVKAVVTRVFSLVSHAHDTLTDPVKRQAYFDEMKQKEAVRQIQAEGLAEEALNHLRKGRVGVALPKLRQAYEMFPNSALLVFKCWGEVKALGMKANPVKLREITKMMDSIPVEDRRTPYYQLVLGLMKKAEGDADGAYAYFDKALALDAAFLDARREISQLTQKSSKKGSAIDILTGDLSQTLSNFFKKKAD